MHKQKRPRPPKKVKSGHSQGVALRAIKASIDILVSTQPKPNCCNFSVKPRIQYNVLILNLYL